MNKAQFSLSTCDNKLSDNMKDISKMRFIITTRKTGKSEAG